MIQWHHKSKHLAPLIKRLQELIFHSDNGVEYTSIKFRNILKSYKVRQSLSRKGTPLDNAVIESLNKTIKRELTNGELYKNIKALSKDINWYIDLYNDYRPHSLNRYLKPNEKEKIRISVTDSPNH